MEKKQKRQHWISADICLVRLDTKNMKQLALGSSRSGLQPVSHLRVCKVTAQMLLVMVVLCGLNLGADSSEVTVTVSSVGFPNSVHSTIAEAQQHVRGLRAGGLAQEIVLDIGEGVHPPFTVGMADSGLHPSARTVYRGKGDQTRVSGGVEIPPSLFKPSQSNPALLTADITSLHLDPASFGEIEAVECIHTCATTRAMLSFNDEEMILARWPNFDRVAGRNVYTHLASGDLGRFTVTPTNTTVKARMLKWGTEEGGWLHGYWKWDWADCYRKLETVALAPATWEVHINGGEYFSKSDGS